jgi:hypothetical protein
MKNVFNIDFVEPCGKTYYLSLTDWHKKGLLLEKHSSLIVPIKKPFLFAIDKLA